jgi:PTH2 family peptidyl-tRNA hydrolase
MSKVVVANVRGERVELSEAEAIELRNALSVSLAIRGPSDLSPERKLRIYINRKIVGVATPNKIAAHAVHAALIAFGVHPNTKVIVLDKGPTVIEEMRVAVHDAGHTELEPGTLTAGTNWPDDSEP